MDPRLEYQGRASAINEKSVNLETLICRWRNICWHTFAPVIGQRLQLPLSNMKLNNKSVVNGYCLRRKQQFWAEKWDGWEAGMRRSLVHPTESNSPILPVLGLGSQVRACWPGGRGKALNDQYKGGGQQLQIIPFLPTLPTWESSSAVDQRSHWQPRYWGESAGQREMVDFRCCRLSRKTRSSLDNRRSLNVCLWYLDCDLASSVKSCPN